MEAFVNKKQMTQRRSRRGFTLAETLVVVAIIAILVGLASMAAAGLLASMRQNKLDTIAQDIYVTAQEHLAEAYTDERIEGLNIEKLSASGGSTAGMYALSAGNSAVKPNDWEDGIAYPGLTAMYNKQTAAVLLPQGALSAEVEANHWIIEYNPEYGYIYGVYYSEKAFDPADIAQWYTSGRANAYRSYAGRKGSGVGYYGGGGVLGGKVVMTNTVLNLSVNVVNAEELKVAYSVRIPVSLKERTVRLRFTFTGEQSGATGATDVIMTPIKYGYFNREGELLADSLWDGKQFKDQTVFKDMYPGENVTMSITAELGVAGAAVFTPDSALDTAMATAVFNSLFETVDAETGTAKVSAGRHLQNLNNVDSRVGVTAVVQTASIDFENETEEDDTDNIYWWAETYAEKTGTGDSEKKTVRAFQPINNSSIRSFNGRSVNDQGVAEDHIINGMTVQPSGTDAGMFAVLGTSGQTTTVSNVSLVGTTVNAPGLQVGALAGRTAGDVRLTNVGAFLARDDYSNVTYDTTSVALTGKTVGGLVGSAGDGITAKECYAAQVLKGTSQVGGLFGVVNGTMTLEKSYADCYLLPMVKGTEGSFGGITAQCGSASTITNCYAAGYTIDYKVGGYRYEPAESAGFTPSAVASVTNSYSVMNIGPNDNTSSTKFFSTVGGSTSVSNVYYALTFDSYGDSLTNVNGTQKLEFYKLKGANAQKNTNLENGSFSFTSVSGNTTAYNLAPGLGLTNYPYPYILKDDGKVLQHCGDWDGDLFEPGTLVYFEQYSDNSRGYYGAGSSYLDSSKTVVQDGYALLYSESSVVNDKLGTTVNATATYNGNTYTIAVIDTDKDGYTVNRQTITGGIDPRTYYFRDLPYALLNSKAAANANFYTQIIINTGEAVSADTGATSYYWYNPHFAATVEQVETANSSDRPTLAGSAKNVVRIRTPRQLYLLSQWFAGHKPAMTSKVTLEQERALDYSVYNWESAGYGNPVTAQKPIGDKTDKFMATYNGRCNVITGVDFKSDNLYAGLFGYVGESGKLRNVVIAAQKEDGHVVGYESAPQTVSAYAYIGALAGYNAGYINNCAVAGYELVADTYNTTLYAGGLVGFNSRSVLKSSADTPKITVRANGSNAYVGSFVGTNGGSGTINQTYSLTSLDVSRYTSGTVRVGGFAGSNSGNIQRSYTATAMSVSNIPTENVDGFTTGGQVKRCYFLTNGTYKFAEGVYAYGQSSKTANAVEGISGMPGMGAILLDGFRTASGSENFTSLYYKATSENPDADYPFATPVTNATGDPVHYGDWLSTDVFSSYGMLYWEHEEYGANNGYHFYLVDETGAQFSTLCEAHDDGGVVTEYGYGYYWLNNAGAATPTFEGVRVQKRNPAAEADLKGQFANNYEFVLYDTSDAFAESPDGLFVTGANSYAKATYAGKRYAFSPFFGAALNMGTSAPTQLQVRSIDQLQFLNWNQGGQRTTNTDVYTLVQDALTFRNIWNSSKDGKTPYYSQDERGNYYPVVISWKNDRLYHLTVNGADIAKGSADVQANSDEVQLFTLKREPTVVTSKTNTKQLVGNGSNGSYDNYEKFTYLGFATETGTGEQIKKEAGHSDVFGWTWNQTHDIKLSSSIEFTPIAAAATSSDNSSYGAVLYAWFGSTYNGNSYKIEDININSKAYTVGLFGVTAGAQMKNIILYSDKDAVIKRETTASDDPAGAYSIGGLIGVAYDYNNVAMAPIENCAIAGYRIVDDSKNKQTLGEANVGGLIGVCNGNLTKCSAVTDIEIKCRHTTGANGAGWTQATWGNFIRVGGLTGATMGSLTDCYTGGSIYVDESKNGPLYENRTSGGTWVGKDGSSSHTVNVSGGNSSTSIYIAGIGGSGFAQNYRNFSGRSNLREGIPSFTNCYSYMEFPKLQGTIRSISAIGSVADRYAYARGMTIDNCYYLDAIVDKNEMLSNLPNFNYGHESVADVLNAAYDDGTYFDQMISGTGISENRLFQGNDNRCGTSDLTKVDIGKLSGNTDMDPATGKDILSSDYLSDFEWVSTRENGAAINGKYSFPGSDGQLKGRNYPFPTIVTQISDATKGTVHVHYGSWPKGTGLYSSTATVDLDLLIVGEDNETVRLTNYKDYQIQSITPEDVTLTFSELDAEGNVVTGAASAIITVEKVQGTDENGNPDGTVDLKIVGQKEGDVTITASYNGQTATIQVTVNAEYSIFVTPVTVTVTEDGTVTGVTPVADANAVPTAYQQEDLYWHLTAVNSQGTPIPNLAQFNWKVEEDTIDPNFDSYEILTSDNDEILLRFNSLTCGERSDVQVTAYGIPGVSGQKLEGTRSREIVFEILPNPVSVNVFAYPEDTAQNILVITLYQVEGKDGFWRDKRGNTPAETVEIPQQAPAGYDQFLGYYLPKVGDANPVPFAEPNAERTAAVISYKERIDNDDKVLNVYGNWNMANYTATFQSQYAEQVKIADSETNPYVISYKVSEQIEIPNVEPQEIEVSGRKQVFGGWKVTTADGAWEADARYDAGTKLEGFYGNPVLDAIWSQRYNITYFEADGTTPYTGVEAQFTSYVGDCASIPLYTPAAPEGSSDGFIGWKLKQKDPADPAVTGWQSGRLYKGTITPAAGETFAGDVELVANWGTSYPITYMNGGTVFLEDSYAVGATYVFPDAPSAPNGKQFGGWKVTAAEGTGWNLDDVYQAGQTLDNSQAGFTGATVLTAQWMDATYTLEFLDADGVTQLAEPITYKMGESIILPAAPAKDEYVFDRWVVVSAEGSWQMAAKYQAGQQLDTGEGIYGNAKLQASWTEVEYTVFYDPAGGTMVGLEMVGDTYKTTYTKASGVTLASATKDGYTLDGWKQKSGVAFNENFGTDALMKPGVNYKQIGGKELRGNVTVEAQWKPEQYVIIYQDWNGSELERQSYDITQTFDLRPLPTRNGYTISGWQVVTADRTDKWEEGVTYTGTVKPNTRCGNVTLSCTAQLKDYTIQYYVPTLKDGAVTNEKYDKPQTYQITTIPFNLKPEPATPDLGDDKAYYFTGWEATVVSSDKGGWDETVHYAAGQEVNADGTFFGDVNLTAQYVTRSLTLSAKSANYSKVFYVKKDMKDGSAAFKDYFTESIGNLPTRKNRTLEGWYTAKDGSGVKVLEANGTVASDVPGYTEGGMLKLTQDQTLYAKWLIDRKELTQVDFMPEKTDTLIIASASGNGKTLYLLNMTSNTISSVSVAQDTTDKQFYLDNTTDISSVQWKVSKTGDKYAFQNGSSKYLSDSWGTLTASSDSYGWTVLQDGETIQNDYRLKLSINNNGATLGIWGTKILYYTISNGGPEYD